MTIEITSCSNPYSWYKDEIGTTYGVIKKTDKGYVVIQQENGELEYIVRFCDCKVLDDDRGLLLDFYNYFLTHPVSKTIVDDYLNSKK